jgi:hypothetical protein
MDRFIESLTKLLNACTGDSVEVMEESDGSAIVRCPDIVTLAEARHMIIRIQLDFGSPVRTALINQELTEFRVWMPN